MKRKPCAGALGRSTTTSDPSPGTLEGAIERGSGEAPLERLEELFDTFARTARRIATENERSGDQ